MHHDISKEERVAEKNEITSQTTVFGTCLSSSNLKHPKKLSAPERNTALYLFLK